LSHRTVTRDSFSLALKTLVELQNGQRVLIGQFCPIAFKCCSWRRSLIKNFAISPYQFPTCTMFSAQISTWCAVDCFVRHPAAPAKILQLDTPPIFSPDILEKGKGERERATVYNLSVIGVTFLACVKCFISSTQIMVMVAVVVAALIPPNTIPCAL
jgi:hypothetical protein